MALSAGTYWHPLNLPHYVTLRDLSEFTEALIYVPVWDATPTDVDSVYVLSAMWAPTYADMMAEDHSLLTNVAFDGPGFAMGGWQTIDEAAREEVYLAMILQTQIAAEDLALGQAELRLR